MKANDKNLRSYPKSWLTRIKRPAHRTKGFLSAWLVLPERIELSTSPLPRECSTTELRQRRVPKPALREFKKDTPPGFDWQGEAPSRSAERVFEDSVGRLAEIDFARKPAIMQGTSTTLDLARTPAADAALKAFSEARAQGRSSVECYRAGVAAWRGVHPEQSAEYAAKRAVAVILSTYMSLRVEA